MLCAKVYMGYTRVKLNSALAAILRFTAQNNLVVPIE